MQMKTYSLKKKKTTKWYKHMRMSDGLNKLGNKILHMEDRERRYISKQTCGHLRGSCGYLIVTDIV